MNHALVALVLVAATLGCDESAASDPWLEDLALARLDPSVVIPGTEIAISGSHYVDASLGSTTLILAGEFDGSQVEIRFSELEFLDSDHLQLNLSAAALAQFPAAVGHFEGDAWLEVQSVGRLYTSNLLPTAFELRESLEPSFTDAQDGLLIYVNDRIEVVGDGFFLSESEGQTLAVLDGCFIALAAVDCVPIPTSEVVLAVSQPFNRSIGSFVFGPEIAGIHSGVFQGRLQLTNRHTQGPTLNSGQDEINYELLPPALYSITPESVSLGQYVDLRGGGFVDFPGSTEIFVEGSFTPTRGSDTPATVDLLLLPEFLEGRRVRYVMSEDDELGRSIDLRITTGHFEGEIRVRVAFEGEEELGPPLGFAFDLAPVKQVVFLDFLPSYLNSLRHFGLRAMDTYIRERVAAVVKQAYKGINLEVRLDEPTDFALYSTVDIAGEDINGLGLLGYDNTSGKDIDNLRLYDHIGGVNAVTQQDGYPGFGGIFIESLFAFSTHPKGRAKQISGADATFDQVFDPFRPDVGGGQAVSAGDFSSLAFVTPSENPGCPATNRAEQMRCAVWVLGNMIGTTVSHEIGHSLGLANPDSPADFHNNSDEENRLMDNGGDRPFLERAELQGKGPGRFCRSAYDYLREILPSDEPADYEGRESCF